MCSFGGGDPIRGLILHGSPSGFSRPAEGWSACSNDDILAAAAKQLGVLQQRREDAQGRQDHGRIARNNQVLDRKFSFHGEGEDEVCSEFRAFGDSDKNSNCWEALIAAC